NAGIIRFAAYSLPRLSGQRVLLHGVVWSAGINAAADRPLAQLVLTLQRGIAVTVDTVYPGAADPNQQIFNYICDPDIIQPMPWLPAKPLPLEPGDSYSLVLLLFPRGTFTAGAGLFLNVFGTTEIVPPSGDMVL